jgi:hypothetical protein
MWKKSRSGKNIPDHIYESLVKFFGLKIIDFFDADADPGSSANLTPDPVFGMEKFGSRINTTDPQHCLLL